MTPRLITINGVEYKILTKVGTCRKCKKYIVENVKTKKRRVLDIPRSTS